MSAWPWTAASRRADVKHMPYFDVLEAMRAGHCPICFLGRRAVESYVGELIHEGINDPRTRARTRGANGLCRSHAWYLRRHGGVPGMFLMYRDVLQDAAETLRTAAAASGGAGLPSLLRNLVGRPLPGVADIAAQLAPRSPCPVCVQRASAERLYTDVYLTCFLDDDIQEAMGRGAGLCLEHLCMAMERARSEPMLRRLLAAHADLYGQLLSDLDDLISQLDYTRRRPGRPTAAGAGIRTLSLVSGEEDGA